MSATITPMPDPDGHVWDGIDTLKPSIGVADETPEGRVRSLDTDTYLTYRDMYCLLTQPPPGLAPEVWAQQLQDRAASLNDLHTRTEETFTHAHKRGLFDEHQPRTQRQHRDHRSAGPTRQGT